MGEWRSEDAKENRVAMAASIQALRGKRVFTGTPNVKLIIMISLSCALIEQQRLKALVPEAWIKYLGLFSCFVRNLGHAKRLTTSRFRFALVQLADLDADDGHVCF